MKRVDAYRKIRTICQRLDELTGETFSLIPQRLYLFGSSLTDKPNPTDVNLMLFYARHPSYDSKRAYTNMVHRHPTYEDRLSTHLRKGMQRVEIIMRRVEPETPDLTDDGRDINAWYTGKLMLPPDRAPRLIWSPGMTWPGLVAELEKNPLQWDEELAAVLSNLQAQAEAIAKTEGDREAIEWRWQQIERNYETYLATGRLKAN